MRQSKYNTRPASHNRCNNGHGHGSRAEATYCNNLYFEMADLNADPENKILGVDNQPIIELVAGIKWKLDFRVYRIDSIQGMLVKDYSYLVDVKGAETREFPLKLKIYRWMLEENMTTEPLLIAHVHQSKGMVTFSETWYPKSAGEKRG